MDGIQAFDITKTTLPMAFVPMECIFFLGDLTPKDVTNGIVSDKYRKSSAGALLTNLPKALLIAIVMALFTLVFGEIGLKNGALVLVSFTMAALFQKLILQHADVFVDYPLSYLKEQR